MRSNSLQLRIINKSRHSLPEYHTSGSAGFDVRADLNEPIILSSGEWRVIPTGLFVQIPDGYELQVRSRSGLAAKNGLAVLNSPGTIDSDYRGEIGVILINHSTKPHEIVNGDRVAQLVLAKHETAEFVEVSELDDTDRGQGGFGHTGH